MHADGRLGDFYAAMVAIRELDRRFDALVRTGRASIMTSAAGHEAAHVGIATAVRPGVDWLFPYYRDQGLLLALGVPPVELFGQMLATQADPGKGRQTPTHTGSKACRVFPMSSPVGSHLPVAVGAAMAVARREPGAVVVCTFGDGATSTGDFHGALTMAGIEKPPIVFVCENNRYAISVPVERQCPVPSVSAKAAGYGMPGATLDGLDVSAVHDGVAAAIERARDGGGPTLLELDLYRFAPHSSSDDDSRYRAADEVERRRGSDPIHRCRVALEAAGLWTEEKERDLIATIRATQGKALAAAEAADPIPPHWMFDDVFSTEPWHLAQARRRLERELD